MTAQTEVQLSLPLLDHCEIDIQWAHISKSGKLIKHWGTTFGPCYLLDRFEEI